MAITITLDEATSARVQGIPLTDLTRWVQEYLRQHLPESGTNGESGTIHAHRNGWETTSDQYVVEPVVSDHVWDAETITAVQEGIADVEAGRYYTLDQVEANVMAKIAAWEAKRATK